MLRKKSYQYLLKLDSQNFDFRKRSENYLYYKVYNKNQLIPFRNFYNKFIFFINYFKRMSQLILLMESTTCIYYSLY